VVLSVLDRKWREHLYEMDYLREGIGLRGYAQRDPLVEYQREGFDMFSAMMDGIKEESVGFLFNLEVELDDEEGVEEVEVVEPMRQPVPDIPTAFEPEPEVAAPSVFEKSGQPPHIRAKGLERPNQPRNLSYSAPSEDGDAHVRNGSTVTNEDDAFAGVGRNALCPCGSGKKYKRCHGAPGGPTGLKARVN
jgi:preprotein translocase subunit SecA